MYEQLTAFLPRLQGENYGERIIDRKNNGSSENPIQFPYVDYDQTIYDFEDSVYRFTSNYWEAEFKHYREILKQANIQWNFDSMKNADEKKLDGKTVVALILGAIRAEHFCDGALLSFFEDGCIQKWLTRLSAIDVDAQQENKDIQHNNSLKEHVIYN